MRAGLKTRITKRHWHRPIESCRIEGRVPQTVEEFRALLALTNLLESRSHFSAHWRRSIESLDGRRPRAWVIDLNMQHRATQQKFGSGSIGESKSGNRFGKVGATMPASIRRLRA